MNADPITRGDIKHCAKFLVFICQKAAKIWFTYYFAIDILWSSYGDYEI